MSVGMRGKTMKTGVCGYERQDQHETPVQISAKQVYRLTLSFIKRQCPCARDAGALRPMGHRGVEAQRHRDAGAHEIDRRW